MIKRYSPDSDTHIQKSEESAEIRHLQKELKRATEERDLLKKPRRTSQVTSSKLRLQCWLESGGVYGYRKLHRDLSDLGELCDINRVHRLMQQAGLRAQVGYRKPRAPNGEQHVVTPNRLERQFNPLAPNQTWVTDITYIKTHEGWLYLGVVMDLFSRRIIGWSMSSRITKELVIDVGVAP